MDNTKKNVDIDLMDFISKSDFSSVGGANNAKAPKHEETKVDIRKEVQGPSISTPFDLFFDDGPKTTSPAQPMSEQDKI